VNDLPPIGDAADPVRIGMARNHQVNT